MKELSPASSTSSTSASTAPVKTTFTASLAPIVTTNLKSETPEESLRRRKAAGFVDFLPGIGDDSDADLVRQSVKPVNLTEKAAIPMAQIQPPNETKGCDCSDGILANFGLVKIWNTSTFKYLDPGLYLTCSGEVMVIMLIVAWIVTLVLNEDFVVDNVLKDTIGYNDVCVGFDVPPANYITAILYGAFLYMSVRFSWTDIARVAQEYRDKHAISKSAFIYSYVCDVFYMGASAVFVLVFVIPPTTSLWGHFMAFLQLVLVRWFVILSYFVRQLPPTTGQWWGFALYTIVTFGFFICMVLDLVYQPAIPGIDPPFVPVGLAAFFDYSWFVSLLFTSTMLPKQPRLLCTTILERYTPTPVVPFVNPNNIDGNSQGSSIVSNTWVGDTQPMGAFVNETPHSWNWEYLSTWKNFSQTLSTYFCCTYYRDFGQDQYDNTCLNIFTLILYWIFLFLGELIFIPALGFFFVGWSFGAMALGFLRLLEIWGCLTVHLSRVYCIDLTGAKNPELHCHDVWVARPVPRELDLDFYLYRVPGYLMNIVMSYPTAFARLLSGRARPPIIKDELLNLVAFGSWVSHLLVANDPNDPSAGYFMDCSLLAHVVTFKNTYMTAERVNFNKNGEVTSIAIRNGGEHKPGDKLWPLAKAHLQGSMIGMGLIWAHTWQHFVFPDAAGAAQQRLPRHGVLYKLLAPHLRFTVRINQVRDHGSAIENQDNWWHYILVYILLPMTSDEFLVHNSVKTNSFYFPDDRETREGKREAELVNFDNMLSQFKLPPFDGTTPPRDAYHYMMHSYYRVIREFVAKVWPDVAPEDWALWKSYLVPILKIIDTANPVDVLATLIWTVSVVHSADHCSLGEGRAYWISYTQKDWDPADADEPRKVFARWGYCRTQSFFDVYGTRWTNPILPLYLSRIDHDFDQNHLMEADQQLRQALVATDKALHDAGACVVPLDALLTCLCF